MPVGDKDDVPAREGRAILREKRLAQPVTEPGEGQARRGRHARADDGDAQRRYAHLLHSRLEVKVTGLLQVQPDHGHPGHGLHCGQRLAAPRAAPLPGPAAASAARATPPLHAGSCSSRGMTHTPTRPAGRCSPAPPRSPLHMRCPLCACSVFSREGSWVKGRANPR